MSEPKGEIDLNENVRLRWESEELIPPPTGSMVGSGMAGFRVAFYDVHVALLQGEDTPWFEFEMRKVGYVRTLTGLPGFGAPPK